MRNIIQNPEIVTQEATLKIHMVDCIHTAEIKSLMVIVEDKPSHNFSRMDF